MTVRKLLEIGFLSFDIFPSKTWIGAGPHPLQKNVYFTKAGQQPSDNVTEEKAIATESPEGYTSRYP